MLGKIQNCSQVSKFIEVCSFAGMVDLVLFDRACGASIRVHMPES